MSNGVDPNGISVEVPEPEKMSTGRSVISTLKAHAGGIVGGGAGSLIAPAAASWLLGPEVGLPVTIGAGIIGALGGGYAGQKAQEAVLPEDTNIQLQKEAEQAATEHPIVSGATDITASALASGGAFSPKTLFRAGRAILGKKALSEVDRVALSQLGKEALTSEGIETLARNTGDIDALKNVALQSTLNPAIDAGVSLATEGRLPSVGQLGSDVAGGALFARPSVLGKLAHKFGTRGEPSGEPTQKVVGKIDLKNMPAELDTTSQPLKMKEPVVPPIPTGEVPKKGVVTVPPIPDAPVPPKKIPETPLPEQKPIEMPSRKKDFTPEELALQKEALDSEEIGTMPKYVKQDYSPEDLELYKAMREKTIPKTLADISTPEYQSNWKAFEELRNKYGGMPPKQLDEIPGLVKHATTAQPFTEEHIAAPHELALSIRGGKATTGSVLSHLANTPNHPFGEMAKHLLSIADKNSLKVPWRESGHNSYYYYDTFVDDVNIHPSHLTDARVLMEEAIHSLTSKKLDMFRSAKGTELKNKMDTYLKTGDNDAIKDLIKAYQKVADHFGFSDHLFKDIPVEEGEFEKGAAGDPIKMMSRTGLENREVGYIMGNLDEFIAGAFKHEQFQNLLNEIPSDVKGQSIWQRIVDSVRQLLGFDVKQGSMLENVLKSSSHLISQDRPTDFNTITKEHTLGTMPKDESKKGFLKSLEATFDKVDRDSTVIGEAGRRWQARKQQFLGLRNAAIVDLQNYPTKQVNDVVAMRREAYRNGVLPSFTPEQTKINDVLQRYYGGIADTRREVGLKIDERKAGKSEWYVPDQLNDKALDLFTTKSLSPEAIHAENVWINHVFKEMGGTMSKEAIRSDIQDYIAALGGKNNNYNSVKFGAIRKAAGYGLPEGLRETDGIKSLSKYGGRAASDLSMFMELESKPVVAASLKLNDPNTGKLVTHPDADPRLAGSTHVRDMMKWVTSGFSGTMSQSAPKINALVRLVNNAILGTATGLRDTAQMPVFALPYINRFEDLSAALKGISNFRKESRNALETGARQPSIDKTQFNDIAEGPDRFTALLGKVATGLRKWQGREAIENFNRDITFAVGKELAISNIIGAQGGNKRSVEFLKKFGTLVDVDPLTVTGDAREKVLNQIASNFTDRNQGTYSGTGLPAGIIDSQFAPFFSLQKWSVEKSNVIYKDVVKPALEGSNYLPLISYTLGSLLSGVAIQKLNELLTGHRSQDPTVAEALAKGDPKSIVGELATLMQLSSLGGIIGDSAKFAADVGLYGKTPRNLVSFPTATAALDLQEKTTDMVEALRNGEDFWDVWKAYTLDLLTHNVQMLRLAEGQVNKDDTKRGEKFRDLRIFNQLEGGKANADIPKTNQYLDLANKEYKQSTDVNEAANLLPTILKKAISDADGDPYVLMQKLRALKGNSYQTMPSFETMPIKFLRYINNLKTTQGDKAAAQRLEDYLKQKTVNKVKSALVP